MQTEHEIGVILFAEKGHSRNSREVVDMVSSPSDHRARDALQCPVHITPL